MDERAPLRTVAHALEHRFYLFVAVVAVFALVSGLAVITRSPAYRAVAVLSVDERFVAPQGFDISLQTGQPLVDHYIQSAASPAVLIRACSGTYFDTAATHGLACTAPRLAASVSASAADTPGWVDVSVTAGSAVKAAGLADAVAEAMVDQNKVDDAELVAPIRRYLTSELTRLESEISSEQAAIDQLRQQGGQDAALATHENNLALLQKQYLATAARLQDLSITQARLDETLSVVQSAVPPSGPFDPDPLRYVGAGLVAGLCVAFAVVLLVDRFDDRLIDTTGLSAAAGTRLTTTVAARDSESLTIHASNPYAVVFANVMATHPHLARLMIVGASGVENLRPIAAGLAAAAAKGARSVLVLDADAPALVMKTQTSRNGSAVTVVTAPAADPLARTDAASLEEYDFVITIAPPPDANPIAISLARSGEVAIVVATAGTTRFSHARRTAETLRLAGIDVSASILSIDAPKEVTVADEPVKAVAHSDLHELAAAQARLPTWRGPGV